MRYHLTFYFRMENLGIPNDIFYEFKFTIGYGWPVKVSINHPFEKKSDLKIFKKYSFRQQKKFANFIFEHFKAEKFHLLEKRDLINPFAKQLSQIFSDGIEVYWIRCPRNTVLIIMGMDEDEKSVASVSLN